MGLDAWFHSLEGERTRENFNKNCRELAYWRKFWPLHSWMERQWRLAGKPMPWEEDHEDDFNVVPVELTTPILDALEHDFRNRLNEFDDPDIPAVDYLEGGNAFIRKIYEARQALADGLAVFYYSWW